MNSVTLDGAVAAKHAENTRLIVQISCVATLGGFLFGFDSGVINGTVDGLKQAFQSTSAQIGFEVASMLLGCALGAFFAGRVADHWGRRSVLIISSMLFLISALGAGAAHSATFFVFARIMGGFAVGAASVIAPAYIAEVAPARYRGRLATVQQIAIISGLFSAFLSNFLLAKAAGASTGVLWLSQDAWRWMFWMQALPSSLFLVSLLFIPESPRFLVVRKRDSEAKAVLARLYGEQEAANKFSEIGASLAQDRHRPKLSDLLDKASGRVRPIVWVGIGLATFQQLVGINVVFYYGAVLWQAVGFSENDALLINVFSGAPLGEADWNDPARHRLAMLLDGSDGSRLAVLINGDRRQCVFTLPSREGFAWQPAIETQPFDLVRPLPGRSVHFMIKNRVKKTRAGKGL